MRAVYRHGILHAIITLAPLFLGATSNDEGGQALVWWPKTPLIFSENETLSGAPDVKGILPEIWATVVEQCESHLLREDFTKLKNGKTLKVPSPLPKAKFSEVVAGKSILMPVKLRKEKESCTGIPFIKLLDSPGVAVLLKKTLTGTDLLNAILLAWPILIFVVLSASISGFVVWFLVSLGSCIIVQLITRKSFTKIVNYDILQFI